MAYGNESQLILKNSSLGHLPSRENEKASQSESKQREPQAALDKLRLTTHTGRPLDLLGSVGGICLAIGF